MNVRTSFIQTRVYFLILGFFSLFLTSMSASAQLPDFTGLVEKYGPAVVNISTTQKVQGRVMMGPGGADVPGGSPLDDFLRKFFGMPGMDENGPGMSSPREFKTQSLGSGFIISPDGYVVTNAHVVKNADKVTVRLTDRREYDAKIIGKDETTDIALLKIPGRSLPTVRIGDPNRLKVGAWVAAIGAPFGFENSVTSGIVGAKGRSFPNESYVPFLQTDVAINPGNSGGPLFNMEGEVVGVNSMIYSRTGGFMGLSFSIPIDIAMNVVNQIRSTGKVSHGYLGVGIQDVTQPLAQSFKLPSASGAMVSDVMSGGPAAKAGLKTGDVIMAFNGKPIAVSGDLPPLVGMTAAGTRVELTLIRNGKTIKLPVVLGELPKQKAPGSPSSGSDQATTGRLGMAVAPLPPQVKNQLKIHEGVLVVQVGEGPAADAGFRPGDVIIQMAQQPVKDISQFQHLVASLPVNKPIPVLVRRPQGTIFLALQLRK